MSGFVVLTGERAAAWCGESAVGRLLELLAPCGRDVLHVREVPGAVAVGVRHEWEEASEPGQVIATRGDILVAADAALYYKQDLYESIGTRCSVPPSASAAELIAAAYEAYGERCADIIEGDFAFVVWDGARQRMMAARDGFGSRPLFHLGDGSGAASLTAPLRAVAGDPRLDRSDLLRALTLHHGAGTSTPWEGVRELPAGWLLERVGHRTPRTTRYWYPQRQSGWRNMPAADAGEALACLLGDATVERLGSVGTALAMSGGRDSTAIAGVLAERRDMLERPFPDIVSFQYPHGDPGNEDRYVNATAESLNLDIRWLSTDAIPVLNGAVARGERRLRPEPHPFEGQNRALAAAARAGGANVLLNGNGGDNLFGLPDAWLGDLFRTGRWLRLSQQLRAKGYTSTEQLRQVVLRPALPLGLLDSAERLLGRRILSRPWEVHPAPWIESGLLEEIATEDRETYRREIASVASGIGDQLRLWSITYAGFNRNNASLTYLSRDEGVELRMPFYDRRVADFAWSLRPEQLSHGREHKVVLRWAMDGRLPEDVIASRPGRTGTSDGYFRRALDSEFPVLAKHAARSPVLADLGLVDARALGEAVTAWCNGNRRDEFWLFQTISTEIWLRAQEHVSLPVVAANELCAVG